MEPTGGSPHSGATRATSESDRLRFAKARESDRQDFCRWYTDPVSMRFVTGEPLTDQEADLRFDEARRIGHRHPELGFFSVRRMRDDAFVGIAKITPFPSRNAGLTLEVGYGLLPFAYGRGYATEILRHLVDRISRKALATELVGLTDPRHDVSIRVLHKCGFAPLHGDPRCPRGSLLTSLPLPALVTPPPAADGG